SQLLVNIYMNEFDQYIKHTLRIKYYIRYADDFVILDNDKRYLLKILPKINHFLSQHLLLQLHPNKVFIKTISSGLDFLGWIHFPNHRILRTSTKRRMFRNLKGNPKLETIASYMGMLKYGNTKKIFNRIVDMV
ncbi:MAG: RNA-directed DNA polymerase, partial [Patescibacteria group bacterium]